MNAFTRLFSVALLAACSPVFAGPIVNGSFEEWSEEGFAGWTLNAPEYTAYNHLEQIIGTRPAGYFGTGGGAPFFAPFVPKDGTATAVLTLDTRYSETGGYAAIYQDFHIAEGEKLTGFVGYTPNTLTSEWFVSDYSWVRIYDSNGVLVSSPWEYLVGDRMDAAWEENGGGGYPKLVWDAFTWKAPAEGNYRIELGGYVSNSFQPYVSQTLFDDIRITPVPESGLVALMLAPALLGLAVVRQWLA